MRHHANALLHVLSRPVILFYAFPWLLVILILGTISQRYIGLYESERLFFSSWFIWLGPIPLPGMVPILALLGLSLAAKLILKSPWTLKTSGTIITHMGALLLLLGGLLTAVTAEEGFVSFAPGQEVSSVSDFHARELAIYKNDELIRAIEREALSKGYKLADPNMPHSIPVPFSIEVLDTCRHCQAHAREEDGGVHKGIARDIALKAGPLNVADEENLFGATLAITNAGGEQDGTYVVFEGAAQQPTIKVGGDVYTIAARKSQRLLPFTIRLDSFKKFSYPGTQMASEYESIVSIIDGEVTWQSPIRMNEPLRYKGYTMYQSSFVQADGQEFSVLAVVKNAGRVFPYISSIIMCIGLITHLFVRRRRKVAV